MWLIYQNKIQTIDNLGRKHWKESKFCHLCNKEEIVDHLLFPCSLATFTWSVITNYTILVYFNILRSF
jgi:hypothetical protein